MKKKNSNIINPGNDNDKYFIKNSLSVGLVEFFWGLCLPFLIQSTYLQVFLRKINASNFTVGLIPVLLETGIIIFSFFSAHYTSHLMHKKTIIIISHILASVPTCIFGILYFFIYDKSIVIPVFLICYFIFSCSIGFILPVWQNYLFKIFSETKVLKGLSIMYLTQNITRFIGGIFITIIVSNFSFSQLSISLVFIIISLILFLSSFFFLLSREKSYEQTIAKKINLFLTFKEIIFNKNYIYLIANELSFFALIGITSFYGNYANEYCGINPQTVSGVFVIFIYAGSITAYSIFGLFNLFGYKTKLLISKTAALISALIIIFFKFKFAFFSASFFAGLSFSLRFLIFPASIKKISGKEDATSYFACLYFLLMPLSIGIPLLNGKFLDIFAGYKELSYRIIFLIMALLIIISYFFLFKLKIKSKNTD